MYGHREIVSAAIDAKYYMLIRSTIEARLAFEPDVETRNRKPLKRPVTFEATAEARQQILATAGIPHADFWQELETESPISPDGSTTDGRRV
jgi:hypothetical protein